LRRAAKEPIERHAFTGEPVDIRRAEIVRSIGSDIGRAMIIGEDEKGYWAAWAWRRAQPRQW
jgi:hypothetical protein